ncbi:hypothetical protein G5B37_14550 [Rasiella rasia]|uniref:YD repeat-containing protein n=1 Tax=Rasiella rasia TaxID=2744027 RepID=A0A6G6GSP3_9FLAO|nr:hypothetical protein [Rasiella rasia]QIE60731.1 hypothetical protein G5B37_14550 [Rasiella rasia]
MNFKNKFLFLTLLTFLFLLGCKDSTSQVTNEKAIKNEVVLKKRPQTPPIKVKREFIRLVGETTSHTVEETKYNKDGNAVEITAYDYYGSGKQTRTTLNTYSSAGNLIASTDTNEGVITNYTYAYNTENQKIKETWSRENGQGSSTSFIYDNQGNVVEEKNFTADGTEDFSRIYEYSYDAFGNITEEKKWEKYLDGSDNLLVYHYAQEFKDNVLAFKIKYNESGKPTMAEEYISNEKGQTIAIIEGSRSGKFKTEFLYNDYGEVTDKKIFKIAEDDSEELSIHNVTSYDKYGNNLGTVDKVVTKPTAKRTFTYEY